jgi:sugar porter (SP) family MFS transporter
MDAVPLLPGKHGQQAAKRQVLASVGAATGAISMGMALGWSSPAVHQMQFQTPGENLTQIGPHHISDNQAEWVGSLITLGAFFSVPLAGPMMERYGRRSTIAFACLPMIVGWFCIAVSTQMWMVYVGRVLTGVAVSLYSVVVPVYIGEIASTHLRGMLGSLFQLLVVFGLVIMYGVGVDVGWRYLAYGAIAMPCVTIVTMLTLHETPNWLVKKGRFVEATEVLVHFRDTEDVSDELDELTGSIERKSSEEAQEPIFKDKGALKVVFYMSVMMMINQLCGINVVLTFTVSIFHTAGVSIRPQLAGLCVGLVMFVITTIATQTIRKVKRRPLLFFSLFFCSLSMTSFGFYFYLSPGPHYGWVPVVCLVLFILSFSMGLGPLCMVLVGDFSLPRIASLAGTVAALTNWGAAFLTTYAYADMQICLGLAGTFWFYGACSAAGAAFVILALPETRGKSFQEIDLLLRNN